jgi:hypothetical protein
MGRCQIHIVSFWGCETLEVVHLALVDKVQVLGCSQWVRKGLCLCQGGLSYRGVTMPIMRVEGEEHLSPDLKGLEFGARKPSLLRLHGIYGWVPPGGASTVTFNAWHLEGPWASLDTVRS